MIPLPYDDYSYLEAPHAHNPNSIARVAGLPEALTSSTPGPVVELSAAVQQSASILYASMNRLETLYSNRFDRLCPSDGSKAQIENKTYVANLRNGSFAVITVDEREFQAFKNQLEAEKRYFFDEAAVDFRQKAIVFEGEVTYQSTVTSWVATKTGFDQWWKGLQRAVDGWIARAEAVTVEGFEETVKEMQELYRNLAKQKDVV